MSMTDPIADMLTRIRNAQSSKKQSAKMPSSKLKVAIARLLQDEGYIDGYEVRAEFEERLRDHTGPDMGITSGAAALKASLDAFGVKKVSALTPWAASWPSSCSALMRLPWAMLAISSSASLAGP